MLYLHNSGERMQLLWMTKKGALLVEVFVW